MKVGIKEIAKAAGVSPSTVSNALNGRRNIGEATRRRVLDLCAEMEYEGLRRFRQNNNKTLLFIFSDYDRDFYLKVIHGISDCADSRGYDLIICTSKSGERFMNRSVTSGCIMLDMHCSDELLLMKAGVGYPVVAMDRMLQRPYIKSLVMDNYGPMCTLMRGLVDRGYRRFAYLGGLDTLMRGLVDRGYRRFAYLGGLDTLDNRERYEAFRDILAENGIQLGCESYFSGDFREKSGYQAAKLMLLSNNLPEVLVCASDNMAIGAAKAFLSEGIKVPERIGVTGFDGTAMADVLGLTTVKIPNYERGYLAAQSLIEILEGSGDYSPYKIMAKVKWQNSVLPRKDG